MKKELISTSNAPKPVACYSQAVKAGSFVFTSGQVSRNPRTGEFIGGDIKVQTENTLRNIKAILEAAGTTLDNVVKVTVYLKDPKEWGGMNEVYSKYFAKSPPVRACAPLIATVSDVLKIEMEVIAVLPDKE